MNELNVLHENITEIMDNREAIKGEKYVTSLKFFHALKQHMRVVAMLINTLPEDELDHERMFEVTQVSMLDLAKQFLDLAQLSKADQRMLIADCELLMAKQEATERELSKKSPGA